MYKVCLCLPRLFLWKFSVLLPNPQLGKSVVGPRTFATMWELLCYNCSPVSSILSYHFMVNRRGNSGNWQTLSSWAPKSLQMVTAATELKDACSLEESYDKARQPIKKQRHYSARKGLSSQSYGFSSSHVWMWELDHEEGLMLKNWCFWALVLEKTLANPLNCKEIKPVNPKGNQSWIFTGRTDAKAEAPILWPPDMKSQLTGKDPDIGKDWRQEKKGMTEY